MHNYKRVCHSLGQHRLDVHDADAGTATIYRPPKFILRPRVPGTIAIYIAFMPIGAGRERNMAGDRSQQYRSLAAECIAMARQASDAQLRASFVHLAQVWIDLAELAEHDPYQTLRHRVIEAAIGEELKRLYRLSDSIPPHLLAILVQLNEGNEAQNGG